MIQSAMTWTVVLCVLLPGVAVGQQDPALVGEGAQVYSANCARCHNARSSTERTDAQWAVIVGHMRVRANMTGAQARAVLAYLQATNLPEAGSSGAGADDATESPASVTLPPELRSDSPPPLDGVRKAVVRVRSRGESDPPH